jgi:hypothetical protein
MQNHAMLLCYEGSVQPYWTALVRLFRSRASLVAEILVLRHQINIQRRHLPQRQTFRIIDRLIFAGVGTENHICIDDAMESPKLAE